MDVYIKFIDGEEITIPNVEDYKESFDQWKVTVEQTNLYFNVSQVKYIGYKHLLFVSGGDNNEGR